MIRLMVFVLEFSLFTKGYHKVMYWVLFYLFFILIILERIFQMHQFISVLRTESHAADVLL